MSTDTISLSDSFKNFIDSGLADQLYSPTDRQRPESPIAKKPKHNKGKMPALKNPVNEFALSSTSDPQDTLNNVRKCLLVQHSWDFLQMLEKITNLTSGSTGMIKCLNQQLVATTWMFHTVCQSLESSNPEVFVSK